MCITNVFHAMVFNYAHRVHETKQMHSNEIRYAKERVMVIRVEDRMARILVYAVAVEFVEVVKEALMEFRVVHGTARRMAYATSVKFFANMMSNGTMRHDFADHQGGDVT